MNEEDWLKVSGNDKNTANSLMTVFLLLFLSFEYIYVYYVFTFVLLTKN